MKQNDVSDGVYFFAILLKYKWFLLIITLIAAGVSAYVVLQLPVWYASTVNFVPPKESASNSSSAGLGAVMKNFGLSKVGGSKSDDYTMLVFLESRSVVDSMIAKYDLMNVYKVKDKKMSNVRKEFMGNIKIASLEEGNYEITIWDTDKERAANMANDYVSITNYFANKVHQDETSANTKYLTERIASIDSAIKSKSDQLATLSAKTNMFAPEEQAKVAGTALASIKETEIERQLMYHYYKQMLGEDDPATKNAKAMLDVTRSQVQDAYSEPGFIGNSTLKEAVPAVIGYMAMSADVEALAQTKALLTTSLEKAQLESKTSSHNFFIVDAAVPADEKDKPKRTLIVAGSTIGGFILGLLIILLINGFRVAYRQAKSIRKSEKAERSKQ